MTRGPIALGLLIVLAVAVAALGAAIASGGASRSGDSLHHAADHRARTQTSLNTVPPTPPAGPAELAMDLERAEQRIHAAGTGTRQLAGAALFEQLATGKLEAEPRRRRSATLALLRGTAAATMRTDLSAQASLLTLATPHRHLPPWTILRPPAAATLLRDFRAAQARYRVAWPYLAAIELIETRFGRIRGPSSAGARGPMQFLPSTWAQYGRGSINDPHQAIFAAARYLSANGALRDMPAALYHYNNSTGYVAAVTDYADRMRSDPRSYYGYYYWRVIYAYSGRVVILPEGFPRLRPIPLG